MPHGEEERYPSIAELLVEGHPSNARLYHDIRVGLCRKNQHNLACEYRHTDHESLRSCPSAKRQRICYRAHSAGPCGVSDVSRRCFREEAYASDVSLQASSARVWYDRNTVLVGNLDDLDYILSRLGVHNNSVWNDCQLGMSNALIYLEIH